jgi:peptidoglycan/xylan/chitin deacetylase (PgdA/CDA1 family)
VYGLSARGLHRVWWGAAGSGEAYGEELLRIRLRVGGIAALVATMGAAAAHATHTAPAPLVVRTSSLTQSGQDLVWSVQLDTPFSPGALAPGGRSLCLLLEQVRDPVQTGQVCLIGPRAGAATPRLQYRPVVDAGLGHTRLGTRSTVTATVTRNGSSQLTATFPASAIGNSYTSVRWQVQSTLASPRCTGHTARACVTLWPAKGAVAALHRPQPTGCAATGPPFVGGVSTTRKEIALTFDDGPWYQTPQFLALLERYKVPATFFEIGEQIAQYGQGGAIERRMLADGDMVGDHTWSHIVVAGAGAVAADQIQRTAAAIRDATRGFTPCLFRAPDGAVSSALIGEARSLGFTTIQWDVDPRDWALPGVGEIEGNVLANAHPGAIVEMHDGGGDRSQTLEALPTIIDSLRSRGYIFVTVTQLLGLHLLYG